MKNNKVVLDALERALEKIKQMTPEEIEDMLAETRLEVESDPKLKKFTEWLSEGLKDGKETN